MNRLKALLVVLLVFCATSVPTTNEVTYYYYFPEVHSGVVGLAKGVALATAPQDRSVCDEVALAGCNWWYSWSFWQYPCDNGVEYVSMIADHKVAEFILDGTWILPFEPVHSEWIAFLNEPDLVEPTCTPEYAAELYRSLEPYLENYRIVTPAPSAPGVNWLQQFVNTYQSRYGELPRFDALAVHCYANNYLTCKAHTKRMISWATSWGIDEVWVTEFSFVELPPTLLFEAISQEARQYIRWMRNEPMVTRCAWFTNRHQKQWGVGALFDYNTGELNAWGRLYRTE